MLDENRKLSKIKPHSRGEKIPFRVFFFFFFLDERLNTYSSRALLCH